MHYLLAVLLLNFNLYCLLVTQCSQNDGFTDLSPRNRFRSERISKPRSDIWLCLRCHNIVDSSLWLVDISHESASCSVSSLSMYRFAAIFYAFIIVSAPLTISEIPFST
ncbi:hypothetical protein ACOSP7_017752 [Xanthoceras sorbifolium]